MTDKEKLCIDCNLVLDASKFSLDRSKKSGLATYCKSCQSIRRLDYYTKNAERLRKATRDWYHENKERSKEAARNWVAKNKDRQLETRRKRHHDRMKTDPTYRLDYNMRASLQRLVKKGGSSGKLGYTADQLRKRIEYQFVDGMTWGNYGDWEIDHKIPMSIFLRRGETRTHIINSLSNLQPMWKFENRSKGARYVGRK